MAENRKTLTLGNIRVSIIKGDLAAEKADVIVCTAHKSLDLSKGRASNALKEVAGSAVQKECSKKYTEGLENSDVAVVTGGNLKCKNIFFIALPVWKSGGEEVKTLTAIVKKCLKEANKLHAASIVFPALGTGYLRYPTEVVAKSTLSCIAEFSANTPKACIKTVTVVVFHKDTETFEKFCDEARTMSSGGDTATVFDKLMSFSCSTPPPTGLSRSRSGRKRIGKLQVTISAGNVAEYTADAVVNSTNGNLALKNGALSEAILNIAGPQLQEECWKKYPEGVAPGELAVTGAYSLKAGKVYHGTLPDWNKKKAGVGTKALHRFVCNCLEQADSDEFFSIAFPALGTGSLDYPMDTVANTMYQCIAKFSENHTDSTLHEVIIVVYNKGDDWRSIKQTFEEELADFLTASASGGSPTIHSPVIKPGMPIFAIPSSDGQKASKKLVIKSTFGASAPVRGTKEFCKEMYNRDPHTPSYWTVFHSHRSLKDWHSDSDEIAPLAIPVDQQTFDEVSRVVEATWKSQWVGHGRDAQGLGNLHYRRINVKFVHRIENSQLYEKYSQKRQELFQKAAKKGTFKPLREVQGSKGDIETTLAVPPGSMLTNDIYPEVNEHYLFHGTRPDVIDVIVKQGLDCRLSGTGAMFGGGIYCAESSTKSDQYSDDIGHRTDGIKKMLLIRVCLGEMFIRNQPKSYLRAPCKHCKEDKCTCSNIDLYDSVVGDGQWNFREFVVYDRTQVYPEYVITYERQ